MDRDFAREVIKRAEYHLYLGLRNFCIYIYSNVGLPAAWKNVTKKKKNQLVAVSVSVALGTSLESGGRIKRQSVFEGAEP